jgi:hypothetical protein
MKALVLEPFLASSAELITQRWGSAFSPKGWEFSAQGTALGTEAHPLISPKGWDKLIARLSQPFGLTTEPRPRAVPWAENSQPFGLKTGATSTPGT